MLFNLSLVINSLLFFLFIFHINVGKIREVANVDNRREVMAKNWVTAWKITFSSGENREPSPFKIMPIFRVNMIADELNRFLVENFGSS